MLVPLSQKHVTDFCIEYNKHYSRKINETELIGLLARLVVDKNRDLFTALSNLVNRLI